MTTNAPPASPAPVDPPSIPPRVLVLCGFMGSGKSTVGRLLASRLGWDFLDTDERIEAREGRTIPEIFERDGEAAFRDLETAVARELASLRRTVVATGGGFVLRPENREAAALAGPLVHLEASPERVWERVRNETHRPLLRSPDPRDRIRELLAARASAYGAIPYRIRTDDRTPEEIADRIARDFGLVPDPARDDVPKES